MGSGQRKRSNFNRFRRLTKNQLHKISVNDQCAFDKWLSSKRKSKKSQQDDLPSSKIIPKTMLINKHFAQLFVVIDTCSIVSYRTELIDYVVRLKEIFPKHASPVRLIISLVVLEELDKCNRNPKKRNKIPSDEEKASNFTQHQQPLPAVAALPLPTTTTTVKNSSSQDPPRMFMRFIEEEMRSSEILISELDPFKRGTLDERRQFEVINKDDRILECCLRTQSFLQAHDQHKDTKVILVSEDNVFKSKATTFDIVSYRWKEFEAKFKNFGLTHYLSTPSVPGISPLLSTSSLSEEASQNCEVILDEDSLEPKNPEKQDDASKPSPLKLKMPTTRSKQIKAQADGKVLTQSFYRLLSRPNTKKTQLNNVTEDESVIIVKEVINIR